MPGERFGDSHVVSASVRRRVRLTTRATLVMAVGWLSAAIVASAAGGFVARVDRHPDRLDRHPRSLSVVAVGDWLPENSVNAAAAGFARPGVRFDHEPLLRPIAPMIGAADLAICHMETPIGGPVDAVGFGGAPRPGVR